METYESREVETKNLLLSERLEEIKNNTFFLEELDFICSDIKYYKYYKYIIDNIKILKNNKNSYILWAAGKTNEIDKNKCVNFNKAKASLPDIDIDVQSEHREALIDYIRGKYGEDCVAQIITFSTLRGSGALKEVFRIHEACDFTTSNAITKNTPEEARVSSKMNEDGETSLILWTLKKIPSIYKDYCTYDENGYHGEYAKYFEQAVRLEGLIKSTGKHAAGVLVSNTPLYNKLPMMYDENTGRLICGMEFSEAENMGMVKLDCLGVSALSKVKLFSQLLKFGKIDSDFI